MNNQNISDLKELPPMLNAKILKSIMGLSNGSVHALMKSEGFPLLKINNKRKLVPRDAFLQWLNDNTGSGNSASDCAGKS